MWWSFKDGKTLNPKKTSPGRSILILPTTKNSQFAFLKRDLSKGITCLLAIFEMFVPFQGTFHGWKLRSRSQGVCARGSPEFFTINKHTRHLGFLPQVRKGKWDSGLYEGSLGFCISTRFGSPKLAEQGKSRLVKYNDLSRITLKNVCFCCCKGKQQTKNSLMIWNVWSIYAL